MPSSPNSRRSSRRTARTSTLPSPRTESAVAKYREDMKDLLRWKKYLDAVSTDENLKKFVAANKDVFNQTQVRASHIVLRCELDAPAADKEKAKQKIAAIKQEIDSGKITFADAANKYSEDPGNKSSPSGGDLGFFIRRGQFNEQFTAAAFALKKGVVSDPVETPFGYHLILVTDRKEGTPIDFEAKKLMIRNEYGCRPFRTHRHRREEDGQDRPQADAHRPLPQGPAPATGRAWPARQDRCPARHRRAEVSEVRQS